MNLNALDTEKRNQSTEHLDRMTTEEITALINGEDQKVALAVQKVLPQINQAVDIIFDKMDKGGRLIYCGCGTSGRLGILDAVECPPTFSVSYETVVPLMAGGQTAFVKAVEGAEDDKEAGKTDLQNLHFTDKDVLVGIAASGRTPYVIGAMEWAKKQHAPVIALVCTSNAELSAYADVTIAPIVGAEVLTGSTRMKSGTAQKMVLNMLSTTTMVKLGKAYKNLMVDVKATNEKLVKRAVRIVCQATEVSEEKAEEMLKHCDYSCKTAIVCLLLNMDKEQAQSALAQSKGHIYPLIKEIEGK